MYYVPYLKAGSKTSPVGSETSVESSHSGTSLSWVSQTQNDGCSSCNSKLCRIGSAELRTLLSYEFRVSALFLIEKMFTFTPLYKTKMYKS